jgi:L-alanine-DL-glutamate epimerase-like enolase superfamily enzyme
MCTPNWELQEHRPRGPEWTDVVDEIVPVRDGYLIPPDRPGLGIALNDAGLALHPPVAADMSRAPLREDGSVAIR